MRERIGIIGFGNMGSAIAERLKDQVKIYVFDKDENKTKNLSGINVTKDVKELLNIVDTVILAVKPQDFDNLLSQIKDFACTTLIISIAAGISTEYIQKRLDRVAVIRLMPNLPAKVGKGMICLAKGAYASQGDLDFAQKLFVNLGSTLLIDENMMDKVTAISGSGPGFLYRFIEGIDKKFWEEYVTYTFAPKLREVALNLGFSIQEARILAQVTAEGSLSLLEETGLSPEELCRHVTSKAGTTEAGLKVLDIKNISSLEAAIKAALHRVKELSKEA